MTSGENISTPPDAEQIAVEQVGWHHICWHNAAPGSTDSDETRFESQFSDAREKPHGIGWEPCYIASLSPARGSDPRTQAVIDAARSVERLLSSRDEQHEQRTIGDDSDGKTVKVCDTCDVYWPCPFERLAAALSAFDDSALLDTPTPSPTCDEMIAAAKRVTLFMHATPMEMWDEHVDLWDALCSLHSAVVALGDVSLSPDTEA